MGGGIIGEELIKVIWGPTQIPLPLPEALRGAVSVRRRLVVAISNPRRRHRPGRLLPRWPGRSTGRRSASWCGPECRIGKWLKRSVIALAACSSGVRGRKRPGRARRRDVGLFQQNLIPQMGCRSTCLVFIVIIIGGLGSTTGAMIGALLVGLVVNYVGFVFPALTQFASIGLLVAVLLWRPQGIYPVVNR